jgi:restriction endonuclease fold toxin 7 of polymorphic toxin system
VGHPPDSKIIGEIKNTAEKVYLTGQIRDEIAFAQSKGYTFYLFVRDGATFSGPLQEAIDKGLVNVVRF